MVPDAGHISWRMPIISTPPRSAPVETASRMWTPFVQSKLSFEQQSPILPPSVEKTEIASSIAPHISASTSDDTLRSSLSAARAELNNSTFQIDHLRKLVLDLEQENAQLKSNNSVLQKQQSTIPLIGRQKRDSTVWEQELQQARDDLEQCERQYHDAIAHHRLEKISLEADRNAKSRELIRLQQELEEITVLYKGKTRCLQQLQELHELQSSKDGHSRADDSKIIDALTSHVSKLRDALSSLKQAFEAERAKCSDLQSRLKMMKQRANEESSKSEQSNSELLAAREEIDELLTQLSDIDSKRKQAGGNCVRRVPGYKSDAISRSAVSEPARSSTPTDLSNVATLQAQTVVAYKDASTCTFADTILESSHPEIRQKKLLDTESHLSAERATICQLRAQITDMEERERESEKLCDMLQSEIEKMKKPCKMHLNANVAEEKHDDSKSAMLDFCMDECNELRKQNLKLATEIDRMRNEHFAKDEELQKLQVRLSQRPIPLHNPIPTNDCTTVVNDSVIQETSFSQMFSPISSIKR